MVENRNVISLVRGIQFVNLSGRHVLLSTGSASFDASSFEYWSMLLNGGELVLCPEQTLLNGDLLKEEIRKRKVNIMWFTSSLLNQWVELDMNVFEGLRTVIAGGEKLSEKHIEKLRNRYPTLEIINGYGPTENTTFSLTYHGQRTQITKPIPIGFHVNNRTAYILNNQLQLCDIGVIGELYVGGAGVARGYLNRPDMTRGKIYSRSFQFRTRSQKCIVQVTLPDNCRMEIWNFMAVWTIKSKSRGFRIEPAEIESVIQQFPGIQQTVVIARGRVVFRKKINSLYRFSGIFSKDELTSFLQLKLPAYMVPRVFIPLNRITA